MRKVTALTGKARALLMVSPRQKTPSPSCRALLTMQSSTPRYSLCFSPAICTLDLTTSKGVAIIQEAMPAKPPATSTVAEPGKREPGAASDVGTKHPPLSFVSPRWTSYPALLLSVPLTQLHLLGFWPSGVDWRQSHS